MKNAFTHGSFVLACALLLVYSSCSPVYFPNRLNVPMLDSEGDAVVSLGYSSSGIEPQAAYALSNRVAVMANLQVNPNFVFNFHSFDSVPSFLIEAAPGFYFANERGFRYDVFLGGGYGWVDNFMHANQVNSGVAVLRAFLQQSIGLSATNLDVAFSTRLAYPYLIYGELRNSALFIEPAFTIGKRFHGFKYEMQIGFSLPLEGYPGFDYQPFLISGSLQFRLADFRNRDRMQ